MKHSPVVSKAHFLIFLQDIFVSDVVNEIDDNNWAINENEN